MKPFYLSACSGLIALILALPRFASAAACCGGGFAAPSVIVSDDRAQMAASLSAVQITDQVDQQGLWHKLDSPESVQNFRLEAAHLLSDRWQAGGTVNLIRRSRMNQDSSGLGDASLNLGNEILPEWDYSSWRPRGVGFLSLNIPLGTSIYDSTEPYSLDRRGTGFWSFGAGTILTKIFHHWDTVANFDFHRSLPRNLDDGTLHPGWGGNLGAGFGYNWVKTRLGASLTWSYEDPISLDGPAPTRGSPARFATAALAAAYMISGDWSGSVAYTDQTLFGVPANSGLAKGMMATLRKSWSR